MKRLLFLCLFIASVAHGQCDTQRSARAFLSIPSFFSLYFGGDCISQPIHDTTICVAFPPSAVGRIAAFSYSSPSGQPAYVTGFAQYNSDCIHIANGPNIYPSTDTTYVCYTIQAALIDNFCPYSIIASGLAVEFCGLWAEYQQNFATIRFQTCSNAGTHYFDIERSTDLISWQAIKRIEPLHVTSPDNSYYSTQVNISQPGISYIRIKEVDYNGGYTFSESVYVEVPYVASPSSYGFDILGRRVSNPAYLYNVQR